ncbi:MAG: FmdB family zinc ribbon protein [Bacteroidota bacterium]
MPTYTYKREDGTTFDLRQRMTEDALTTCPTTGQPVKRVIGKGAGIIFKGSGFYQTDYKPSGKPESETKSEPAASSDTASSSSDETTTTDASSTKDAPSE